MTCMESIGIWSLDVMIPIPLGIASRKYLETVVIGGYLRKPTERNFSHHGKILIVTVLGGKRRSGESVLRHLTVSLILKNSALCVSSLKER